LSKTSFGIIGGGALGGLYGGLLAKAGFNVHFLLRSDFEHVQQHGWKIETPGGDFELADVHAHRSPETMPPCDVTIVALKTTQNSELPRLLPQPTSQGGLVLVLQNGLDVEAESAAVVGSERVLGGCCFLCSNKVGPGHVRHLDHGRIVFGEYKPHSDGRTDRVLRLCDDLVSAGIDAKAEADLARARWQKLMWNIPFNGLSVVLDASTADLMANADALALARTLIEEVHRAAEACGSLIDERQIQRTLDVTREMVPYDSSMRIDYRNHKPMEVEAIFGNPLRRADAVGCKMPRVEMLYRQLRFLDRQGGRANAASEC